MPRAPFPVDRLTHCNPGPRCTVTSPYLAALPGWLPEPVPQRVLASQLFPDSAVEHNALPSPTLLAVGTLECTVDLACRRCGLEPPPLLLNSFQTVSRFRLVRAWRHRPGLDGAQTGSRVLMLCHSPWRCPFKWEERGWQGARVPSTGHLASPREPFPRPTLDCGMRLHAIQDPSSFCATRSFSRSWC